MESHLEHTFSGQHFIPHLCHHDRFLNWLAAPWHPFPPGTKEIYAKELPISCTAKTHQWNLWSYTSLELSEVAYRFFLTCFLPSLSAQHLQSLSSQNVMFQWHLICCRVWVLHAICRMSGHLLVGCAVPEIFFLLPSLAHSKLSWLFPSCLLYNLHLYSPLETNTWCYLIFTKWPSPVILWPHHISALFSHYNCNDLITL